MFDNKFLGHNFVEKLEYNFTIRYKCSICSMNAKCNNNYLDADYFWLNINDYTMFVYNRDTLLSCNEVLIKKLLE